MIDYLRHMAIFNSVAEHGSFSAAAKNLRIAPSRVSEAVSKLEHFVDATLFHRTTRKVSLTSEGRKLFAYTATLVEDAQQGIDALNDAKTTPSGSLNISMPSYLTGSPLLEAMGAFGDAYPAVQMSVVFIDTPVDPLKDGFDICIRAGRSEDPSLSKRKLGELQRIIVAGRDYCTKQAAPEHPKDLESWDWITYRYKKRNYSLASKDGQRTQLQIDTQSKMQVDNFDALHFLTKLNKGVSVMPIDVCRSSLKDGTLIRLCEDWRMSTVKHFAVWPDNTKRENLISTFMTFLAENLDTSLS